MLLIYPSQVLSDLFIYLLCQNVLSFFKVPCRQLLSTNLTVIWQDTANSLAKTNKYYVAMPQEMGGKKSSCSSMFFLLLFFLYFMQTCCHYDQCEKSSVQT